MIKESWKQKGFVDEPIPAGTDLAAEIRRMCREKNAIILSHYYTPGDVQDVADFVGDSLALAQKAAKTDADIIVMCGVHFMAETNKILCPDKTVLIPDLNAQCSLAESCPPDKFAKFVEEHPGYTVLSYVNTSAAIKALTDVVVTSGNAAQVVESFPKDEKLIFGPDRNLGSYINSVTGRNMLLWDGACHVHSRFSPAKLMQMKKEHPAAKVLAHPECGAEILKLADYTGSTAAMLKFAATSNAEEFLVVTESGILHEMRKSCPDKKFMPQLPERCLSRKAGIVRCCLRAWRTAISIAAHIQQMCVCGAEPRLCTYGQLEVLCKEHKHNERHLYPCNRHSAQGIYRSCPHVL